MPQTANARRHDAIRRQYARNASGFERMLAQAEAAEAAGIRPNGPYTVADLRALISQYRRLAAADDATLDRHMDDARAQMAARLRELRGEA